MMSSMVDISRNLATTAWNGIKDHGPLICTVGASLGLISTTTFAILDTKNYMIAKEDEEAKLGRELTNAEKFKVGAPEYIRTAISGASTLALTWGAFGLNKRVITGLNSSLILATKQLDMTRSAFKDYYNETIQYLPENEAEAKKIKKIIEARPTPGNEEKTCVNIEKLKDVIDNNEIVHIVERNTGMQYDTTLAEFSDALDQSNATVDEWGYCALNTFHEFMNVGNTEIGWDIGWARSIYDGVGEPVIRCECDAKYILNQNRRVIYVTFATGPDVRT